MGLLSKNRHFSRYCSGAVICLALLTAGFSVSYARGSIQEIQQAHTQERPPLYLPEANKVRLITLGFDRFAANLLWFNTLNYFGKQLDAQADYTWLGHMCELVTDLDPKNHPVMEFCATMLSWVAQQPEVSSKLLRKAISFEPNYWRYQYLLGFNYWYFHEQKDKAQKTLQQAALIKGAPMFLANLAARLSADSDNPQLALSFLDDLLRRTTDQHARRALIEKRKLAEVTRDIAVLNSLIEKYENATNTRVNDFSQLISAGMLKELPKDPYAEVYQLDADTREITSHRGKRGLFFSGRTATTGLAHFEKRAK